MSAKGLAPKVVRRQRRRKPELPPVTARFPSEDVELLDKAARKERVTRSDIVYNGSMRLAREILGLSEAA